MIVRTRVAPLVLRYNISAVFLDLLCRFTSDPAEKETQEQHHAMLFGRDAFSFRALATPIGIICCAARSA